MLVESRAGRVDKQGFADFVAQQMDDLRLNQSEVARRMARSQYEEGSDPEWFQRAVVRFQRFISRVLAMQSDTLPKADELRALAQALDTTVGRLLSAAGYAEPGDMTPRQSFAWLGTDEGLSEDERAMLSALVSQIRRNKRKHAESEPIDN